MQFDQLRRREFITMLGSAAAWPLAARAQRGERVRRIGVLTSGATADDPDGRVRTSAFLQGLQQSGWIDGRNIRIDYRWGAGDADSMRKYAAELVTLAPDCHPGLRHRNRGAPIAGDAHGPNRVCSGHRSGRCRVRR
jgi:hypothetical protein